MRTYGMTGTTSTGSMTRKRSRVATPAATGLLVLLAAACADDALTTPGARGPGGEPGDAGTSPLGLVEVTVTGLGDDARPSASALSAASVAELRTMRAARRSGTATTGPDGSAVQSLDPPAGSGGGGDGTIQLESVSTGSFTDGERGAGGVRHLYATFRVRNAEEDGTAYDTPRENLTFLAVDTDDTYGETAVSRLVTFGGTEITGPAADAIAEGTVPTGHIVQRPTGETLSVSSGALQLLTEAEAAAVDVAGTMATDVFPFGFVVDDPGDVASRTLPADPDPGEFDGLVTFALEVPLQGSPADDPFEISMVFLAMDDDETRITQSLEEQTPEAAGAVAERAAALGVDYATLLPGTNFTGDVPLRMLCEPVRVAGAEGAAATVLSPGAPSLQSMSPDPFAADGSASRLTDPAGFSATFDAAVGAPDASNFTVHGAHSGRRFRGGGHSGGGTATVTSPSGSFMPGEVIEVSATPALGSCAPRVARYRMAAGAASGDFTGTDYDLAGSTASAIALADHDGDDDLDLAVAYSSQSGSIAFPRNTGGGVLEDITNVPFSSFFGYPLSLTTADLNGDGHPDLASHNTSGEVAVLLNAGGGGAFQTTSDFYDVDASSGSRPITAADLDGDGNLDLAVLTSDLTVLRNEGDGTFGPATDYLVSLTPTDIAAADFDGDGDIDLAVGTTMLNEEIHIFRNHGNGTFAAPGSVGTDPFPTTIAAGDLDGDGDADLAVATWFSGSGDGSVAVLLNDGDGNFTEDAGYTVGVEPSAIALGDLDGDGDLDLAVANKGDDDVSILAGNGDGTFAGATNHAVGGAPVAIEAGDLDGDGDIDLAVANSGSHHVSLLLNDEN